MLDGIEDVIINTLSDNTNFLLDYCKKIIIFIYQGGSNHGKDANPKSHFRRVCLEHWMAAL